MKLKEKNNILMNLANHTEKSVLMPENPVTLDNPDGIYLYRGRIFALFIPTSAERSNYDHLLRRLYVSQLSYSSDLVTILLLDADDKVGRDGVFIFHESFCHVSRSFDDVLRYIAGVGDINRDWGIIKEHRSIQYQKFRMINYLTDSMYANCNDYYNFSKDIAQSSEMKVKSWKSCMVQDSRIDIESLLTPIGSLSFVESRDIISAKNTLRNAMTFLFMNQYNWDNGYIYPSGGYDEFTMINTDLSLMNNGLLSDAGRMLNFIGVVPMRCGSFEQSVSVYESYMRLRNSNS